MRPVRAITCTVRGFLILSLIFAITAAFPPPTLAQPAVKPIVWKVQGFVPAGLFFHDLLVRLAADIEKMTGGRLVWKVHPAGALSPPFEALDAVSKGVFEANYGYSAQWIGKIPVSPLFCSVPGGFSTFDFVMWVNHGGGKELWQEMYDRYKFNVKMIHAGTISMEIFMWAKKPLRTIDDFKGIKMRMMPLMGHVLSAKGLSVVFMPAAEILPALERGVIDAAEYSVPIFDLKAGYGDVCKYYHYPGIHQPTGQPELLVNKDVWNKLPDDLKLIVEKVCHLHVFDSWHYGDDQNIKALAEFEKKGNIKVVMDPKTVETFTAWAWEYLDAQSAKDPFFKKVWDSQKAWMRTWYPYMQAIRMPYDKMPK